MPYKFADPLIDIVAFYKRRPSRTPLRRFATSIVSMADSVVKRYMRPDELSGVHECIRHQLRVLKWRDYMLRIPLNHYEYEMGSFSADGLRDIVPQSIIATVLLYRNDLNDSVSGLRAIVYSQFVLGLEWLCYVSNIYSGIETHPDTPHLDIAIAESYVSRISSGR